MNLLSMPSLIGVVDSNILESHSESDVYARHPAVWTCAQINVNINAHLCISFISIPLLC